MSWLHPYTIPYIGPPKLKPTDLNKHVVLGLGVCRGVGLPQLEGDQIGEGWRNGLQWLNRAGHLPTSFSSLGAKLLSFTARLSNCSLAPTTAVYFVTDLGSWHLITSNRFRNMPVFVGLF